MTLAELLDINRGNLPSFQKAARKVFGKVAAGIVGSTRLQPPDMEVLSYKRPARHVVSDRLGERFWAYLPVPMKGWLIWCAYDPEEQILRILGRSPVHDPKCIGLFYEVSGRLDFQPWIPWNGHRTKGKSCRTTPTKTPSSSSSITLEETTPTKPSDP